MAQHHKFFISPYTFLYTERFSYRGIRELKQVPQKFSNLNPTVQQLALQIKQRGLAVSDIDAIALAKSISGEKNPARYGSEKIPNRYADVQRQPAAGIQNVNPEEIGSPVRYIDREKRGPGRIENLPYLSFR